MGKFFAHADRMDFYLILTLTMVWHNIDVPNFVASII